MYTPYKIQCNNNGIIIFLILTFKNIQDSFRLGSINALKQLIYRYFLFQKLKKIKYCFEEPQLIYYIDPKISVSLLSFILKNNPLHSIKLK